ncbi:MAG: CBS domain-containing protein [Burkholderiaceae bacterium]
MKVKEVLTVKGNTLFTVNPEDPLSDGVVVMAEQDIGSLVVMDHGRLAGMLTFREVIRILAKRQTEDRSGPTPPVSEFKVKEVMHTDPFVVNPEMDVDELRAAMIENRQRYLPVMDDNTLMGVISFHDVARAVLSEQDFENKMLKAYIRDWPAEG